MQKKVFFALLGLLLVAAVAVRAQSSSLEDEEEGEHTVVEEEEQENASSTYAENDNNGDNDTDDDDDDDDYNPREALLKHLLGGKNSKWAKKVPPPVRYLPVQVQVKMRPLHIDYVCTKTFHIKMPALESYNWTDPRLAWNESQFGGIKSISVDACDIWMPDIGVYQSPDAFPTTTRPKEFHPTIYSSGVVVYMPRSKFHIACSARTWYSASSKGNSKSANATKSTDAIASATPADDSNNKTQTFVCEFDQGSWSNDMSVVDIVPILEGGLATSKEAKKIITLSEQQKLKSRTPTKLSASSAITKKNQKNSKLQLQRRPPQQKSSSKPSQQKTSVTPREYTAKEYNATTDLSWFEPNQLYSVQSFNVKRLVMQYPSVGTGTWSSMHYRLVIQVRGNNATSSNIVDIDEDDDVTKSDTKLAPPSTTVGVTPAPVPAVAVASP